MLPPNWVKFLDEYLSNGFNGTQAYLATYPDTKYKVANVEATKLLAKPSIQDQVRYRLDSQGITDEYALSATKFYIEKGMTEKEWAKSGSETLGNLLRVRGMIKEGERGDKFFQTNYLVYAPMVKPENIKKVQDVIEGAGRIIE